MARHSQDLVSVGYRNGHYPAALAEAPIALTCPYCGTELTFESPLDHIFIARRTCPECGREFLIKDGKAEKSPNSKKYKMNMRPPDVTC